METKQPVASAHPSTLARILIIIVTWNKQHHVLALLASLRQIQADAHTTTVVVDNASQDDTVALIKAQYPAVHLLCNRENLGGTGGFNTGLQWAFDHAGQYDYCWLLDNDVVVHQNALQALLNILQQNHDIAVAGSTMMQLDYPWRINEMGAFVDKEGGLLVLNRHLEKIPAWQGQSVDALLTTDADLSQKLLYCQPVMDVDYVAAASLLIRADVAQKIGLWRDYFIHFDDVEWCLRIRDAGHRVVVSAKSLIWHLSAAAKVPTGVLYYDNRNLLSLLSHHSNPALVKNAQRRVLLKALYYALLGKPDLSHAHKMAIDDFRANRLGKKDLRLTTIYQPIQQLKQILADESIKTVLFSFAVNLQAANMQTALVQAMLQRPDLQVKFLTDAQGQSKRHIPQAQFVLLPANRLKRLWFYWQHRNRYDMVVQWDYQPLLPLSWLGRHVLFVNNEGCCLADKPKVADVWRALRWLMPT